MEGLLSTGPTPSSYIIGRYFIESSGSNISSEKLSFLNSLRFFLLYIIIGLKVKAK